MTSSAPPLLDLAGVVVERRSGSAVFELAVPTLQIRRGEVVAVIGPSGSGKSTLLDLLAFILRPTAVAGHFLFCPDGRRVLNMGAASRQAGLDGLAEVRKRFVGYVPQVGGLLPYLDVRGNIAVSPSLLGRRQDDHIFALVSRLGVEKHLDKSPADLSVGERQRVAIARALAHQPVLVIADEPTAALDPPNGDKVLELLIEETRERGIAAIVATHDWDRVDRFGLSRLQHRVEQTPGGTVRAVFSS